MGNTAPAFCVISDVLVLKEVPPVRTRVMVLVCLTGLVVILVGTSNSGGSVAGCFVALVNPVSWTVYWAIQRYRSQHDPYRVKSELPLVLFASTVPLTCLGAAVSLSDGSFVHGLLDAQGRNSLLYDALLMIFFGIVFLPGVQTLWSMAPRYVPTSQVACIKITETIWGPVWIYLVGTEEPGIHTIIGGAVIFSAITCHSLLAIREADTSKSVVAKSDLEDGKRKPAAEVDYKAPDGVLPARPVHDEFANSESPHGELPTRLPEDEVEESTVIHI